MKNFNNLLKELDISRNEFAEEVGVTPGSLNAMLSTGTGKRPTPKWVKSALLISRKLKEQTGTPRNCKCGKCKPVTTFAEITECQNCKMTIEPFRDDADADLM